MSTIAVLLTAVALLILVIYWSGRYGGRGREAGTSLRRRSHAHTNANGTPKVAFATRDEAVARARTIAKQIGAPMSTYQCDTCALWHVGHAK